MANLFRTYGILALVLVMIVKGISIACYSFTEMGVLTIFLMEFIITITLIYVVLIHIQKSFIIKISHAENENMKLVDESKSMIQERALEEVLPDILFRYNFKGDILQVITKNDELLLHDKEGLVGGNLVDLLPENVSKQVMDSIKRTLDSGQLSSFEYELKIKDKLMYFETRMVVYSNDEVLAIIRDISELVRERQQKDFLIYQDPLTEIFNRRYYNEAVQKYEKNAQDKFGLILIDVNGLKLINDTFGHRHGDNLLIELAGVLEFCIKDFKGFEVARIGGDEFAIICPATNNSDLQVLIELIVKHAHLKEICGIPISVSIGYSLSQNSELDIEEMFSQAEDYLLSRKLSDSQSMRHNAVEAILSTLNEKSNREKAHSLNVSRIAKNIAIAMNLSREQVNDTYTAAKLHDIGKITVEDQVLNKPSSLTEDEYESMKRHVESSYHILKTIDSYAPLADYVFSHHERWDGKGYPRGLYGVSIPLPARIICVADAYEAMRADRSYRKGTSHSNAITELSRCSGTQFDPNVVEIFIRHFKSDWYHDNAI